MITFRHAKETDKEQIKELWYQCFHDEKSYIDMYLSYGFSTDEVYVAVKHNQLKECSCDTEHLYGSEEEIVAMLQMIPVELNNSKEIIVNTSQRISMELSSSKEELLAASYITENKQCQVVEGRYVYAVATKESARGQGLMRRLEAFAEEEEKKQGATFFTLVPASLSLFSLYKQIGYETYTTICEDWVAIQETAKKKEWNVSPIQIEEYETIRQRVLQNAGISFMHFTNPSYWIQEMKDTKRGVIKLIDNNDSIYVLYGKDNDGNLWIQECICENGQLDEGKIQEIGVYFGVEKLHIRLHSDTHSDTHSQPNKVFLPKRPYSMIKWVDNMHFVEQKEYDRSYMNLMLD